jgi:hypothetical protein
MSKVIDNASQKLALKKGNSKLSDAVFRKRVPDPSLMTDIIWSRIRNFKLLLRFLSKTSLRLWVCII